MISSIISSTPGKVLGVGCDIVEVSRIRDSHERHGQHFLDKIYSEEEQKYCLNQAAPYPSLAARFAAKEAISKAFTTGIGERFGWKSATISHGERREPLVQLHGRALKMLEEIGGRVVRISISHTVETAMAIALITD